MMIRGTCRMTMFVLGAWLLAGCVQPISPVYTSTESRIWVVRGASEVYRCVDVAPDGKGPQPICVQAERVSQQQ
jgi:hypothetical protein